MMRAKFTVAALVNYASMVERYGDIYVNEYGQVSRVEVSHAAKYEEERRKVPSRSCMFVHLHRNNFPGTVELFDGMFLEQTLRRSGGAVNDRVSGERRGLPDVVKADAGAFERLTVGRWLRTLEGAKEDKGTLGTDDISGPVEANGTDEAPGTDGSISPKGNELPPDDADGASCDDDDGVLELGDDVPVPTEHRDVIMPKKKR